MSTLGDRIRDAVRYSPLDDDVLAARLGASSRQAINQTARKLAAQGLLRRRAGPDGKIVNEWLDSLNATPSGQPTKVLLSASTLLSEDEVKEAVRKWLVGQEFQVVVAMGRERGIDLDARHPDGRRWIIEAKGAVTSAQQQGSYFLGALGEPIQRMSDPDATTPWHCRPTLDIEGWLGGFRTWQSNGSA